MSLGPAPCCWNHSIETVVVSGAILAVENCEGPKKEIEYFILFYFAPLVHFTEYVAEHWKEDDFFGYQFLNRLNPNRITKCTVLPKNFPVTEEMVQPFLKKGSSLKKEMEVWSKTIVFELRLTFMYVLLK